MSRWTLTKTLMLRERAEKMYKDGLPTRDIRKELGISYATLEKWLSSYGYMSNRERHAREVRKHGFDSSTNAVVTLVDQGLTRREIAIELSCSESTVYRRWAEYRRQMEEAAALGRPRGDCVDHGHRTCAS